MGPCDATALLFQSFLLLYWLRFARSTAVVLGHEKETQLILNCFTTNWETSMFSFGSGTYRCLLNGRDFRDERAFRFPKYKNCHLS